MRDICRAEVPRDWRNSDYKVVCDVLDGATVIDPAPLGVDQVSPDGHLQGIEDQVGRRWPAIDDPTFRRAAGHIAAPIAEEIADDRVVAEVESLLRETSAGFALMAK